ncbi:alpha/beta hydrolase, partial [Helicobacter pylori]
MAKRSIAYLDSVFDISYTFIDNHSPLNALFLHGWGSSKEIMQQAFQGCFLNYN